MSFSTSGTVAELNIKLGDLVKAGDVLARLEKADDLEANLASAQVKLLEAQQALAALQKSASSTLAQAYQALVAAQAAYQEALTASQRSASGRCSQAVTTQYQTALEGASQKLKDLTRNDPGSEAWTNARYDYDTALANYNYCAAYTSTEKNETQATLEVAKAALQQAEDTYNPLKASSGIDPDTLSMDETKVETAQTLVTRAQEALDGITLTAPIDGRITSLAASVGAMVDTATFLTISDVSHPTVTVVLDETDMDKLVVGNPAEVAFTALPGHTFTGKVSVANPQMNTFGPFRAASGQVELNEKSLKTIEALPLGLSATITITGKEAKNVLLVPVTALKKLKNGDYAVLRVDSDGKLTQQIVTVGLQDDVSAEITKGLKEGDVVSITTKSSSNAANDQGGRFLGGDIPRP
jgi:RND family efflux transporter MFP subunit